MEQYNCRTCLDIIDNNNCTEISKNCYLDKTIQDVIALLVPAMVPTLSEDDLICENCLNVVTSAVKFIERCLEVEVILAENIKEEDLEDGDLPYVEDIGEVSDETIILKPSQQIEQDHDYYIKQESGDCTDTNENADENYEFYQDETQPVEIVFDSSMIKAGEINENFQSPVQIVFDDSLTSHNENDTAFTDGAELQKFDDTSSDIPVEYIMCEEFNSEASAENHEKFTCLTCFEEFSSKLEYSLHLDIHPPFSCEHCKKGFKTEYHYKRHIKIHTEEGSKMCEICGKLFTNSSSLNFHLNGEHSDKIVYMCDKCPKLFKNKFRLNCHVKLVHEKVEQQQCQECGKLFQNKESCENHFRLVHLQLKPFVCDVCGREFGRKDYLQKHMYYHTGEPRPIQHRNKIKSKTSRRGKPPKFGIRLKDPGTPVNCKICGKLILSVHLLKSHLQSHVKIKRHKCSYCELTFTLSNNRDRHQRIHESDPERKFRCNICWKKMKTAEELEHHIVGHYNRPPQHSCDICGEKFHRKYLLDNHHLHKHTDPGDIEKAEKEIVIKNLLEYAHPNDIYDKIKCE